jgi:hypothetical protein
VQEIEKYDAGVATRGKISTSNFVNIGQPVQKLKDGDRQHGNLMCILHFHKKEK